MARDQGFSSEISFGFWDFYIWADVESGDGPQIALKTVKNSITNAVLNRLVTEPTPLKVLLVDGGSPQMDRLDGQMAFIAATGTGVFVRNVGWRALPGRPSAGVVPDLKLRLAPRWQQNEHGVWEKACSKCGEFKTTNDFYPSAYKTARDPFRHICRDCWNVGG